MRCKILSSARGCSLLAVCFILSCLFKNKLGLIFFRGLGFFFTDSETSFSRKSTKPRKNGSPERGKLWTDVLTLSGPTCLRSLRFVVCAALRKKKKKKNDNNNNNNNNNDDDDNNNNNNHRIQRRISRFFYNLFTALQIVSNTYVQVARTPPWSLQITTWTLISKKANKNEWLATEFATKFDITELLHDTD